MPSSVHDAARSRLRRFAPQQRRAHILDVAKAAFFEDGFAATSMSTIAARLGGSKGTLYKYFASKTQLLAAVMEAQCAAALATLDEGGLPAGGIRAILQAFGKRYLKVLTSSDGIGLARLVHGEGWRVPEIARIFFAYGPDASSRHLAGILSELDAGRAIRCPEPLLTAIQFLAMIRGDAHMRIVCGLAPPLTGVQVARLVEHAVSLIAPALHPADLQGETR